MKNNQLIVSAPGRICLFGEHLDYLGLQVITAAIDLRIRISGQKRNGNEIIINLPDIKDREVIKLERPIRYLRERDYFRSSINVLERYSIRIDAGCQCTVTGNIPINSGTSSSSALVIAWVKFLLTMAGDQRQDDAATIARLAHAAEVLEFHEPGGMMDHFAAAFGGVLYIDFSTHQSLPTRLPAQLGKFVLGDSMQPKDTKAILARVKGGALDAMKMLQNFEPKLNFQTITLNDLESNRQRLTPEQLRLLQAIIRNREITEEARRLLQQPQVKDEELGALLLAHQEQLRDGLQISTKKIDSMIAAAMEAGALGAKINGSGGGGCMFAYAPNDTEAVAEAITRAGGKPYIVAVDEGVRVDPID